MIISYPCYKELKLNLGYFDSIIELNELAVREFIYKSLGVNFKDYIEEKSKFHEIRVDFPTVPEDFSSIIAKSYLVLVHQAFEEFLEKFRLQSQQLKIEKWSWEENKPKLETVFKSVDSAYKSNENINYIICEYYRHIRNLVAHKNEKLKSNLEKEYDKISFFKDQIFKKYNLVSVPNTFDKISFNDFVLFTRAVKDLAFELCNKIQYTPEEIAKLIEPEKYSRFLNNKDRLKKAIEAELRSNFGIQKENADEIIKFIYNN